MSWALAPRSLGHRGHRDGQRHAVDHQDQRAQAQHDEDPPAAWIAGFHRACPSGSAHTVPSLRTLYAQTEQCAQRTSCCTLDANVVREQVRSWRHGRQGEPGPVRVGPAARARPARAQPGRDRPRGDRDAGRRGHRGAQHAQARRPAERGRDLALPARRHQGRADGAGGGRGLRPRSPSRPPTAPTGAPPPPRRPGPSARRRCATRGWPRSSARRAWPTWAPT